MTNFPVCGLQLLIEQAYQNGQAFHGELNLEYDVYIDYLLPIINKYLGDHPQEVLVIKFITELHTNDLYLTIACAQKTEAAWQQFDDLYRGYIYTVAKYECSTLDAALDLADNLLSDLYFSDRANRSRIASYEGQSSLARWLRIVITHRAINERERKRNHFESLDSFSDIADEKIPALMESLIRANTYRPMILETFRSAIKSLSPREQYILLMRYEEELQANEIARVLGLHPSNVTRQLQRIQEKIKLEVVIILRECHHLSNEAIKECLQDIQENPEYSILEFIKAG
jgi:RNA polymerase sigma-70 factor